MIGLIKKLIPYMKDGTGSFFFKRCRKDHSRQRYSSCLKKEPSCRSLCDACSGSYVKIKSIVGDDAACRRIREMGFCESEQVYKLSQQGAVLCCIKETTVALSEHLAQKILIES